MRCPCHFSRFPHPNNIGEECKSLSSSLSRVLYSPVTSSLSDPNILLNTLFSNTLTLPFSLRLNDHVLHPYKTTGKVIVLDILFFIFLDGKLEDKRLFTE